MLSKILGVLTEGTVGVVTGYLTKKAELADAKHARELKRIEEWEQSSIANSSWKDEYWTIVLSIPLVFAFMPPAVPYIEAGFAVLAETPEWYRWATAVAIGSAFGVRQLANFKQAK